MTRALPLISWHGWRPAAAGAAAIAAIQLALAGCVSPGAVSLSRDDRIQIDSPANQSTVTLPLTIRWSDRVTGTGGDTVAPAAGTGYYAVFLNRYPMPPGSSLRDMVGPTQCGSDPACPSPELLRTRYGTYVTRETSITVPALPPNQFGGQGDTITIVLLNDKGARVNDTFWTVSVYPDRPKGAT